IFLIFVAIPLINALKDQSISSKRVGIVGAGIGGGATSYYVRQLNPDAQITAFESRDYIGGRLKHIVYDNITVEVGGDAWSIVNEYIQEIVKDLKIPLDQGDDDEDNNGKNGIFNGPGNRWVSIFPSSISNFFK